MDVQIDCGAIYFGLKQIKNIERDLTDFNSAMSAITLPSELKTASLLTDANTELTSIINGDIKELIEIFEESKNILAKSDNHAALLFQYYDAGIIDENGNFTDVPLLTQNDYNIPYGGGTVATSGCGITSLCMVASYILGQLYTPEDLATLANADKSSNVGKMTRAADYLGLNWYNDKSTSRQDLVNYLKEGKLVICLVKNSSHFVVCKGITPDGKILVNDPYRPFRNPAYEDGYTWDQLQFSVGNTWIFDPAANTNATTSAGEIKVSDRVLSRLQNIEIDGVYESTVEADDKDHSTETSTETNKNAEQTSETTTATSSETTSNSATDSSHSKKDWVDYNPSSSSTTSSSPTPSSNPTPSSGPTQPSIPSTPSEPTQPESPQPSVQPESSDKTPVEEPVTTPPEPTTTPEPKPEIPEDKPTKPEKPVIPEQNVDHSTSTDEAVLGQLIPSSESPTTDVVEETPESKPTKPSKPEPTPDYGAEPIPDTKVDKPKTKKSPEPIINPAFIGAALATLSVGAITVAERSKKNKKKASK